MTENQDPRLEQSRVAQAFYTMPTWKRKMLGVSLLLGVVGAGGQLASKALHTDSAAPPAANTTVAPSAAPTAGGGASATPSGASGFVSNSPNQPNAVLPAGAPATTAPSQDASPTMAQRLTPWMTRVGLSFFFGIIIGLVFRTFLKLAAAFTVLIGGIIMALSYFHVLNIDMTQVQTEYASASSWINDQGVRLKDLVLHSLPSSSSAIAGFLSGFKKR